MTDFDLFEFWTSEAEEHTSVADKTFKTLCEPFAQWLDVSVSAVENGNKIIFFGNGGSASDAQHLATELAVRYISDRDPIPALSLATDTSSLTAIGNDMGFEHIFARQINAVGRAGDIAVGISTSGKSPNVIKALEAARKKGITTVGLSGRDGGDMHEVCDLLLIIPSHTTARIQEMHITLGQMFCGAMEQRLGLV